MAINYSWHITRMRAFDVGELQDVVGRVYFKKIAIDDEDGVSAVVDGEVMLELQNLDSDSFVEFSSLTEADVISWLQTGLTEEYQVELNAQLASAIENNRLKINRPNTRELPWAN